MPIISQVSKDTDVRNVTVVGRGESFDKAAQNAAKNALTEVVGTFLDSKTLVNKKTVIDDGLVERTKEIRVDISEYSQGSIQSLKIIDAYQENNLAIVIAKVRVRIDDFRRYVEKLSSGRTDVSAGLFAAMTSQLDNQLNGYNILMQDVFKPLAQGKNYIIKMGEPQSLTGFYGTAYCTKNNYPVCDEKWGGFSSFDSQTSVIIPVHIRLNPEFRANMLGYLDNIASKRVVYRDKFGTTSDNRISDYIRKACKHFSCNRLKDHIVAVYSEELGSLSIYLFTGLKEYVNSKYGTQVYHPLIKIKADYHDYCYEGMFDAKRCPHYYFSPYSVNFRDIDNHIISSYTLKPHMTRLYQGNKDVITFVSRGYRFGPDYGMNGIGLLKGLYGTTVVTTNRRFWLGIQPELDLLKKTRSISIDYLDR